MFFDTISVGELETNCYLIGDEKAGVCAIVDPGGSPKRVLSMLEKSNLRLEQIFLTHGHWDHVEAVPTLLSKWPDLPVYAHEKELCPADEPNPHYFFPHAGKNQRTYDEGDILHVGSLEIKVLHTPGHTAGSVVLLVEDTMISGDTLFAGTCGRIDFPGGNEQEMMKSLARLGRLEGEWRVCSGHGPITSMRRERRDNPFLKHALSL